MRKIIFKLSGKNLLLLKNLFYLQLETCLNKIQNIFKAFFGYPSFALPFSTQPSLHNQKYLFKTGEVGKML